MLPMKRGSSRPFAKVKLGSEKRKLANELVLKWLENGAPFDAKGRLPEDEHELVCAASPDLLGRLMPRLFRQAASLRSDAATTAGDQIVMIVAAAPRVTIELDSLADAYATIDAAPIRKQLAWSARKYGMGRLRGLAVKSGTSTELGVFLKESLRVGKLVKPPLSGTLGRRSSHSPRDGVNWQKGTLDEVFGETAVGAAQPDEEIEEVLATLGSTPASTIDFGPVESTKAVSRVDVEDLDVLTAGPPIHGGDLESVLDEMMAEPARMTSPAAELPKVMYPLVDAPRHVVMAEPFTLCAGITKNEPFPGAPPMKRPESVTDEYTIDMDVQHLGFRIKGNTSKFELRVTREEPYPKVEIILTPSLQSEEHVERSVTIFYTVQGQVIGSAVLPVVVHTEANDETRAAEFESWRRVFSTATYDLPPDLTVMVTDDRQGRLAWSFVSPHQVPTPRKPIHTTTGTGTREFARLIVNQVNRREGSTGAYDFLVGIGAEISEVMPPAFWDLLTEVSNVAGTTTPSVLIISSESYIPWELAAMEAPLDPTLPPFLGAQARVGRWVVSERRPPRSFSIKAAAVVRGTYALPSWKNLQNALDEADAIVQDWGASAVDATEELILGLLKAPAGADLLHFAMHGQWDETGSLDGLITIDGKAVSSKSVAGALLQVKKADTPFVFLNACQVGTGSRMIGDYSGIAAEFLKGGAAAVIAPLWSIKDEIAKQIALDFYHAAFTQHTPAAEVIRRERAKFKEGASPTYLAYQYFGHPSLEIDASQLKKGEVANG